MKRLLANYSFDASAGEITITDINPIRLDRVLLVVNATYNNTILYSSVGGSGGVVATNVLYVSYDCSLMSDTDKLLIFYDDVPETAVTTSVASSASSTTLLAANANRFGATIYNDSTQVLYVKLGATASATSFTAKLAAGDYYEVPYDYSGIIDGIWAAADGYARITEV